MNKVQTLGFVLFFSLLNVTLTVRPSLAQPPSPKATRLRAEVEKTFGAPRGMTRLDPDSRIWADKKNRRVVVDGYVALRDGQLEMLACIEGTKEHESVVAVFSSAQLVHAGLLAVGAQQGKPVQWDPEYVPPSGSEIKVMALWLDAAGKKHAIDARDWIREVGTENKTLDANFVFAGSSMWTDPNTGEERYLAEDGSLICVANFLEATLDVPLKSPKTNSFLTFAAFTDRIPETGTPVRLVLEVVDAPVEDGTPSTATTGTAANEDSSQNAPKVKSTLAGYERLIESPEEVARAASDPTRAASAEER